MRDRFPLGSGAPGCGLWKKNSDVMNMSTTAAQGGLFGVLCNRTKPPPGPATAVADFIAIDDVSTDRWLCKGQSKHPLVPATEWLCSRIAQACMLPVPVIGVVELRTNPGTFYFGSQWLGGAKDYLSVTGRISNPEVFAATHAVDLFVHNTDRHRNNFLYLDLAGDIVARVMDFSHSLLVEGWPLPSLPMAACNTTNELPFLLSENPAPYVKPSAVLAAIQAMPNDWMQREFAFMPTAWLDVALKAELDQWWSGSARLNRLIASQSALP